MKYYVLCLFLLMAIPYRGIATPLSAQKNNADSLAADYIEMAKSSARQGDYKRAIELYNKGISQAPQNGKRRTLMEAFHQLGLLYEKQQNYREALNYYRRSSEISDSLDFVSKAEENTPEAYSRNFMRDVMGSINQKPESADSILKTIDKKKSLNDTLALSINYFNLGLLYKGKQQFPESETALRNCIDYADKIHYTDMENSALTVLADLYEQQGDYKQSVVCIKKRMELNSPANLQNSKTIGELQTKYEITQREDQVLRQQFEITKRNYWMTGIAVVVVLLLIIGFIYYKQTKLKQRNIAMQAIIATEESERKRIAQDLHDSVSQTMSAAKMNLAVIGGELTFTSDEQKKRFDNAIKMVDDGFKEVRTISHNMMPWALNETGLARVIEQFIKNTENSTIAMNFMSRGFDAPFDGTTEVILYRVLQEAVNNVLKHAQANRLDISLLKDEEGNISLSIEDNGIGFDMAAGEAKRGMGLNNLYSRINFLKGKVEYDSHPGKGTLVSVYIPFAGKKL